MLKSFFMTERMHAGWRFWILWVLATNFGFFVGLAVEQAVFQSLNLTIAVPMAGLMQAWILNRHIVIFIPWIVITAAGWWLGVLLVSTLLNALPPDFMPGGFLRLVVIAAGAGAIVGLPQAWALHGEVRYIGWWWVPVSAIGWAVFVPGVISGIPLAYFIEYDYRDLEYRSWP